MVPIGPDLFRETNTELSRKVEAAVSKIFPIQTADGRTSIVATAVRARDDKHELSLAAHQKAKEAAESITVPVEADLELWREGRRVQSLKSYRLGELPLLTPLGTFAVSGNDYFTPHMLRLKPGVYTREAKNGDFESFIALRGRPMTMWMEPSRGVVKLGTGSTNVNLYPILRALGAGDPEILQALGGSRELLEKNTVTDGSADVAKFTLAVLGRKENRDLLRAGLVEQKDPTEGMDDAAKRVALRTWFGNQKVDGFVTRKTLGQEFTTAELPLLLATLKKLIGVSRHDIEPDDRDALEFKTLHNVADMLPERLLKLQRVLKSQILNKLSRPDSTIGTTLGTNWLNPGLTGYFGGTGKIEGGMANTAEAANPLAILGEHTKTTVVGDGGISDTRAITDSARLFRPGMAGFIDSVHTPEGAAVGVTTHLAVNAYKTADNRIASMFYPVVSGRVKRDLTPLTVEQASDAVIGYPEFWDEDGKPRERLVRANVLGRIEDVDASRVQYVIPSGAAMFDHTSNAALFFAHTHPNRGMMAGKHLSQALPLTFREAPLSDLKVPGSDESVYEKLGKAFTVNATEDGTVERVTATKIVVSGKTYELYDHLPMQAKVALTHIPVVKVGDKVKAGQLLAENNYTKDGKLALGVNLHSAYLPWKNASNYEDAIVISDSAAHKLSSDHVHRYDLQLEPDRTVSKKMVMSQFPTVLTSSMVSNLDEDGVIKEGSRVALNDVLIAAVDKRKFDEKDRTAKNLSNIHKSLLNPYKNASIVFDLNHPGEVYRVIKRADAIEVHVKTSEPIQVGDKLSMSSAAKGTVSQIIPDHDMPRNKDGEHIEVILNPHGVAGRINPSQTIEQAAGKLVKKYGKAYDHSNFDGVDHAAEIQKQLAAHGDEHTEKLFDPMTGKWLEKPVATGYNYMYKLDHSVRKKFSARETDGYTADEAPTRGAGKSGQSYDQLTTYALLGHNAHALLGESAGIRGQKNEDFWIAYQAGETPPAPKVPFVFDKFRALLMGAGVNMVERNGVAHWLPLTEKTIREKSNGRIESASQLRARGSKALDVVEEKGGLFDPEITGGVKGGTKWAHIELDEKVPHPLYEKVINDLLGTKRADYYGLLAHTRFYDPKTGKFNDEGQGLTGAPAFKRLLDFDVEARLTDTQRRLRTAVGSDKNRLFRASRYLRGLLETKLKPADAYMTSIVPVVPPIYRPIMEMKGGALRVADSNYLYRDMLLADEQLRKAKAFGMPAASLKDARMAVYQSFGALVGVNNALTHRDDRLDDAAGFIDVIKGRQNKEGLFQRSLARRRNDLTGRSTIEPDAALGPDQIGLPEDMAWKIFKPILVRRMVQRGWKPIEAQEQIEKRTMAARAELDAERKERPVIFTRAPALHRWSTAAAFAEVHNGQDIKISPASLGGMGADHDGDTVAVIAPVTDAAKVEALNLLPKNSLFYDRNRSLAYTPDKDIVTGLFQLTRPGVSSGLKFDTDSEALQHFANNQQPALMTNSLVQIKGDPAPVTVGWLLLRKEIPARFLSGIVPPIDGKKVQDILRRVAETSPSDYSNIVRSLTQAGFTATAAIGGVTSSIDELAMNRTKVKRLIDQLDKSIKGASTPAEKTRIAKDAMKSLFPQLNSAVADHLADVDQGYHAFLQAKMSGKINPDQFRQMLVSPVFVKDIHDQVIPAVIKSNYGEGMRPSDYLMATPGARKGMVDKSLATAQPGALAKEISAGMAGVRIYEKDCGTFAGIDMPLESGFRQQDVDILDRHLAVNVPGVGERNDPVTATTLSKARDKGLTSLKVRSPMTCEAARPPCQMCAGRSADGTLHPLGANIGINYGQTLSERSTQTILRSFHSGGTAGTAGGMTQGFSRLRELLAAPDSLKGQGTLADTSGTVSRVRQAPQGGYYVNVGETEHYVLPGRTLSVKAGDTVGLGDPLSDGSYRPQELAAKKGNLAAQMYVTDQVRKAYESAGEVVRKPVIEVVVAEMMRWVEITNDGGEHGLAVGDVMHENEFAARKAKNPRLEARPYVPGLTMKPVETSKDLVERLSFQRLEDAVREVPAMGGTTDLSGTTGSPVSGFAYGANFRPGQAAHELPEITRFDTGFVK